MTSRSDTNAQPDDTPLRIVGHRLHKVDAGGRTDAQTLSSAPHARAMPDEKNNEPQHRTSILRQVVLVDREIDALRDVAIALRDEYDFHITISGNEALNLLRSGAIDTIVVGQTLYSSTGLTVLAEARRHAPSTRRVLLANAVEATSITSSSDAAPFKVLHRPCTLDKLRALLESASDEHDESDLTVMKTPINTSAPGPKVAPTARAHFDTHNPADFEHVVLESLPELPKRRSRPAEEALQALPVIVYTDDAEFYRTISLALKDRHNVRLCTQLERAAEFAEIGQCPLLITDRAATQVELQRISIALRALDAGLIVIAAGTAEVGAALRKFLGTGALHSFLTKPLNVPLVRLAVESGKRQYLQTKALKHAEPELHAAPTKSPFATRQSKRAAFYMPTDINDYGVDDYSESTWRRTAPIIGIAAALIIAALAGGWYWWQHRAQPAVAVATNTLDQNLESAKQAYAIGRYAVPNNDSALFYYSEALKISPQDVTAKQGIELTIERIIEQAEKALLEERLDVATDAIATVRTLQPKNNRLPFLESQLNKERKGAVARESNRATQSASVATTSNTDVAVKPITNEMQRHELVNRWLASARQRIAQDRLLQPDNDSAEYYLRQAERADPDNTAVRQSLREVGTRLVINAREALSRQQFDQARKRALDATRFGADSATIDKLQQEIEAAANTNTRGGFLRLALQRTRDNRLFEPEHDSAKFYLGQLQRLDSGAPETEQATRAFALKLIENVDQSIAQNQTNAASQLLNEVKRLGFNGPELTAAEARLRNARNPVRENSTTQTFVAPKAIKTVPPKFPEEAARSGVQGWVDVEFKITASGDVADVNAIASSPPGGTYATQFERAAVTAIRQYKYEARTISSNQTQRMVVRVQFKLD